MKTKKLKLLLLAILLIPLLNHCTQDMDLYKKIRTEADRIRVINTHEHQRWTSELPMKRYTFYQLLYASYLAADVQSAGAETFDLKQMDTISLDALWDKYGKYLGYTSSSSYYGHFVRGFSKLYNFKGTTFTKENIADLSVSIEENYKDYPEWFDKVFNECGYEIIILDQYWDPLNVVIDQKHYALAFNINVLVETAENWNENVSTKGRMAKEAETVGLEVKDFEGYLTLCDHFLKKFIENNVVCLKNSQAYTRSLYYEDVPYEEASRLFRKGGQSLTQTEKKRLEDFMFHWVIKKSIAYKLPIQIHTGYLAGNGNNLENGNPVKLNNLFLMYPDARFILFHGGFPRTGEYVALGKMFRNVYLDLVWLPQISRSEAVRTFDMMLDCVPYNKIMWGGDCHLIEESAGSLEYAKDVVSEVLAARVEKGFLTEDEALIILKMIFRENAIEVFDLKKRLNIEF